MTEEQVKAIFLLAGVPILAIWQITNEYWPDHPDYDVVRRKSPWWLVRTSHGMIKIGWRKRVINIDWSDTPIRGIVTKDEVTKDTDMVHAYTYWKAVEYLASWSATAEAWTKLDEAGRAAWQP